MEHYTALVFGDQSVTNHSSPAPPVAQLQADVPLAARHAGVVEIHGAGVRVADAARKGDVSENIY